MAFVTRVLLFAFFQIGAVDGTVLGSNAAFTSASAVEDERMLRRDTLDEESYTKSKANAAASIAAWKQKVAMQGKLKSGDRELTEAERRKIMQIKHADLEKKYGTPAAVAEKPKPLRFSPLGMDRNRSTCRIRTQTYHLSTLEKKSQLCTTRSNVRRSK